MFCALGYMQVFLIAPALFSNTFKISNLYFTVSVRVFTMKASCSARNLEAYEVEVEPHEELKYDKKKQQQPLIIRWFCWSQFSICLGFFFTLIQQGNFHNLMVLNSLLTVTASRCFYFPPPAPTFSQVVFRIMTFLLNAFVIKFGYVHEDMLGVVNVR